MLVTQFLSSYSIFFFFFYKNIRKNNLCPKEMSCILQFHLVYFPLKFYNFYYNYRSKLHFQNFQILKIWLFHRDKLFIWESKVLSNLINRFRQQSEVCIFFFFSNSIEVNYSSTNWQNSKTNQRFDMITVLTHFLNVSRFLFLPLKENNERWRFSSWWKMDIRLVNRIDSSQRRISFGKV